MKLFSHTVMEPSIITVYSKRLRAYPAVSFMYEHKGGGPVLKGTPHVWTYISGFLIQWRTYRIPVQFRRFGK